MTDNLDIPSKNSALGLSKTDQLFLTVVSISLLSLIGFHTYRLNRPGEETIEIQRLVKNNHQFQIEINKATWVEWMQLEAVGEATGRNIVADREESGPFKSISDLRRVKGIGAATLNKMQPHLKCSDCD